MYASCLSRISLAAASTLLMVAVGLTLSPHAAAQNRVSEAGEGIEAQVRQLLATIPSGGKKPSVASQSGATRMSQQP